MRKILLILSLFYCFGVFSQNRNVYTFQILDQKDQSIIPDVLIINFKNNSIITQSNNRGYFSVPFYESKIRIRMYGYESKLINLDKYKANAVNIVLLKPIVDELEPISLEAKPFKRKPDVKGFEFWRGGLVALARYQNEIIVTDFELNLKYKHKTPSIDGKKAHSIYRDVEGNIFLIGKNKVVQVYVTDSMVYTYQPRKLDAFNTYIKNLKVVTESGDMIYRNTEPVQYSQTAVMRDSGYTFNMDIVHPILHNCGSEFIAYDAGGNKTPIYWALDTNKYFAAAQQFNEYLSLYIFAEGKVTDRRWGMALHTYKHLYAKYQEVPMFKYHSDLIVFDAVTNRMVRLNNNYVVDTIVKYDYKKSLKNVVAVQDIGNDRIWMFERKGGSDNIRELTKDLVISSNLHYIGVFTRNIRIKHNVVFYLDEDHHIAFYHIPSSLSMNN